MVELEWAILKKKRETNHPPRENGQYRRQRKGFPAPISATCTNCICEASMNSIFLYTQSDTITTTASSQDIIG